MADDDKKAPTKKYQLLADGMIIDGVASSRGDIVDVEAKHGERLAGLGALGPVGYLERMAKAEQEAQRLRDEAATAPEPQTDAGDVSSRQPRRSG